MSLTLQLPKQGGKFDSNDDLNVEVTAMTDAEVKNEVSVAMREMERLSDDEKRQLEEFAAQINLRDDNIVMYYGGDAQSGVRSFADEALQHVRSKDLNEVGNLLGQMFTSIKGFNDDASKGDRGFLGIKRSIKQRIAELQANYQKVAALLSNIEKELVRQQTVLSVDMEMLNKLYDRNLEQFRSLTVYILAGQKRLGEVRQGELQELWQRAQDSHLQEDALAYDRLKQQCLDFEKQLSDLDTTRTICLQTAPQIRMIQQTNKDLIRQIQSSIMNLIPIWETKIMQALAMEHSRQAAATQNTLRELTSQMIRDTADSFDTVMTESQEASNRGIVDIEAVVYSTDKFLETIRKVAAIQENGVQRRREAGKALANSNEKLRTALLGTAG